MISRRGLLKAVVGITAFPFTVAVSVFAGTRQPKKALCTDVMGQTLPGGGYSVTYFFKVSPTWEVLDRVGKVYTISPYQDGGLWNRPEDAVALKKAIAVEDAFCNRPAFKLNPLFPE